MWVMCEYMCGWWEVSMCVYMCGWWEVLIATCKQTRVGDGVPLVRGTECKGRL